MEISPIPGIRALPAVKSPPADPQLSAIFDIEHSSEPGDDTYAGNGKRAAGGQDEQEETDVTDVTDWAPETESPNPAGSSIDLIA